MLYLGAHAATVLYVGAFAVSALSLGVCAVTVLYLGVCVQPLSFTWEAAANCAIWSAGWACTAWLDWMTIL